MFTRIIENLIGRLVGPLTFRLVLQPVMAVIAAVMVGVEDARLRRPAYFWAMVSDPAHRRMLVRDGWKDIATIFVLAVLMDVIYQVIALRWVYPGEAVIVAFLLAAVPYLAVRGPVGRFVRWMMFRQRKEA